jgi:hypothetical protein
LLFEGNAAAVAWQEREAARLVAEEGGAPPRPLPPEGVDALHDFLSSFAEPGPGVPRDLGIARLAVLPSAAAALEETVLGLCNAPPEAAAGVRAAAGRAGAQGSTATDALTGLLTVRWRGKEGSLAAPLPALKEVAGLPASSGTLIYLPPEERRNWDYLLQPDPNRELAESVLRVFDPRGIFSPGRLRGAARAAPA